MKNALEWIKNNPFSVVMGAVSLVGILVIGYIYLMAAPAYSAEKSELVKKQKTSQSQLLTQSVPLPDPDPNAEPINHSVVINQVVTTKVKSIYDKIKTQYESILDLTGNKNANRHRSVMLGNGEIWPDANPDQNFALYVQAASDYLAHFKAVFDYQNPNRWNMPRMVAGSPPTPEQIQAKLSETAFNFVGSIGASAATALSQTQAEQLYAEQRQQLMKLLTDRARSIHLYVDLPDEEDPFYVEPADGADATASPQPGLTTPSLGTTENNASGMPAGYPFQLAAWAKSEKRPNPDQLWEGQVELWILRDVMTAIHEANNVGKTVEVIDDQGRLVEVPATVLNSPVKRLLKLHPLPAYVGLHNIGGVFEEGTSGLTGGSNGGLGFGGPAAGGLPGTAPPTPGIPGAPDQTPSIYPAPPIELQPGDVTREVPEHFGLTPTGRVSNAVFDVRHTRLEIDIEWDALPAFIDELRKVNYMSVIKVDVTDIDEYEMLREGGYVYGGKDVVRATLLIESLWFRSWTAEFMPKIVKEKLLIILPQDQTGGNPEEEFY